MFYLRGNLLLRALPVLHCAIYNRSRGTFSFRQYVSQLIRFRFRILDNSCHLLDKSHNQRVKRTANSAVRLPLALALLLLQAY